MAREHRHLAVGRGAGHRFGVACAQGEGLLHEARLPRFDARERERRVGRRWRRDDDGVHAAEQIGDVRRGVHPGVLARHTLADRGVGVAHRRQRTLRQARRGADVVPAPRAGADHPDPHAAHR